MKRTHEKQVQEELQEYQNNKNTRLKEHKNDKNTRITSTQE